MSWTTDIHGPRLIAALAPWAPQPERQNHPPQPATGQHFPTNTPPSSREEADCAEVFCSSTADGHCVIVALGGADPKLKADFFHQAASPQQIQGRCPHSQRGLRVCLSHTKKVPDRSGQPSSLGAWAHNSTCGEVGVIRWGTLSPRPDLSQA